jgi:Rad51
VAPPTQRNGVVFQQASTIPHFSLGFPKLDSLLRPLSSGSLVLLSGKASSTVAELAAFRAQLPVEAGGLDSAVVYIDGDNKSDPYLFSSFAKQGGLRPAVAMRRVTSCRIFTLYQLASLVSGHLARSAEYYGIKLVIISGVLGTFNEPELEEREARRVLGAIEEGIQSVKKHALVIATLPSPNKHDDTITSWADVAAHLSSEAGNIRVELLKHMGMPLRTATFRQSQLLRAVEAGVAR